MELGLERHSVKRCSLHRLRFERQRVLSPWTSHSSSLPPCVRRPGPCCKALHQQDRFNDFAERTTQAAALVADPPIRFRFGQREMLLQKSLCSGVRPTISPARNTAIAAASGKQTFGLLRRRNVRVERIIYIGKESNRLGEIEAGVIHSAESVYTEYPDPHRDEWQDQHSASIEKPSDNSPRLNRVPETEGERLGIDADDSAFHASLLQLLRDHKKELATPVSRVTEQVFMAILRAVVDLGLASGASPQPTEQRVQRAICGFLFYAG